MPILHENCKPIFLAIPRRMPASFSKVKLKVLLEAEVAFKAEVKKCGLFSENDA